MNKNTFHYIANKLHVVQIHEDINKRLCKDCEHLVQAYVDENIHQCGRIKAIFEAVNPVTIMLLSLSKTIPVASSQKFPPIIT